MKRTGKIFLLCLTIAIFTVAMRNQQHYPSDTRTRKHNLAIRESKKDAATDKGFPPRGYSIGILQQLLDLKNNTPASIQNTAVQWTPVSPHNFSGRITALALASGRTDTILAGAADGGIWRSTDAGNTFLPVFDFMPSLSIGSLAFDPMQSNIAYAGTGEANANGDSYPGAGIFSSSDGGATWQYSGLDSIPYLSCIVINPNNTREIFTGGMGSLNAPDTLGGVFHSTNAGATWTKIFSPGNSTGVIDVQLFGTAKRVLLCAAWQRLGNGYLRKGGTRSGMYRSTNMGSTWEKDTTGLPTSDSLTGRIAIASSRSNPSMVYAEYDILRSGSDYGGIYKSTDAGISWKAVSGFPADDDPTQLYQGWYNKVLAVNPVNENDILFGDTQMYRSTDGGMSWSDISATFIPPPNTHVDQHAIAWSISDTSQIFVGNDGGTYKINYDSAWQFFPIPVAQFYSSAIDSAHPSFVIGGTQDNGLLLTPDTSLFNWLQPEPDPDYGETAVNPGNPNTMVAAALLLSGIVKSNDGGSAWYDISGGITGGDPVAAVPPLFYDPQDTNDLFTATNKIYRTTNGGLQWEAISPAIPKDTNSFITCLACDGSARMFLCGASDGTLALSKDGGSTWASVSTPLAGEWFASAAVANVNGALYAGYASIDNIDNKSNTKLLFRSTDSGETWQPFINPNSGFTPAAVNAIVIDDKNDSILFIGTDAGVYVTTDLGQSWQPLGAGLPNAAVVQINFYTRERLLRAATHGRAMWNFVLGAWERSTGVHEQKI